MMLLPMILSTVVGSLSSGILVSKLRYYTPFLILSSILITSRADLLTILTTPTGHAKWIGYQVLFGFGIGFGIQQPINFVQTVPNRSDIATANGPG